MALLRGVLLWLSALALLGCPAPRRPPLPVADVVREPVLLRLGRVGQTRGELTLPVGLRPGERRPGIVLIHGSGPADQDETIPRELTEDGKPARLFGQLAQSLSRSGFIVLRYHKRGVRGPIESNAAFRVDPSLFLYEPLWRTISRESLTEDAAQAVALLRADPRVESVSLLGFSEGTMIAPLLASRDPSIRALILLSVVGRNLKEVLRFQDVERELVEVSRWVDQNQDGALLPDEISAEFRAGLPFERLDTNRDGQVSRAELAAALEAQFASFVAKVTQGEATESLRGTPKGWYRSWFQAEDNLSFLPRLRPMPVLLVQGEDDAQTPFTSEAQALYQAMRRAGRTQVTMLSYAELGHGFSLRKSGRPTLGPIDPVVLRDIGDWARQTLFSSP